MTPMTPTPGTSTREELQAELPPSGFEELRAELPTFGIEELRAEVPPFGIEELRAEVSRLRAALAAERAAHGQAVERVDREHALAMERVEAANGQAMDLAEQRVQALRLRVFILEAAEEDEGGGQDAAEGAELKRRSEADEASSS